MNTKVLDGVLQAMLNYVSTHPAVEMQRFKSDAANWGAARTDTQPTQLPGLRHLDEILRHTCEQTHALTSLVVEAKDQLSWRQSGYTEAQVGAYHLDNYAFAEIVGPRGPFISDKVRMGMGFWGPEMFYPTHRHQPEEIYNVISGNCEFQREGEPWQRVGPAGCFYVPSNRWHTLRTNDLPVAMFYVWRGRDLDAISGFKETG